jgi:hypothetical protein
MRDGAGSMREAVQDVWRAVNGRFHPKRHWLATISVDRL